MSSGDSGPSGCEAVLIAPCARVTPARALRNLHWAARPVPLGGNAYLAFYKLRTSPDAYYTMVMRRVTDRAGLARYVLVNALPAQ